MSKDITKEELKKWIKNERNVFLNTLFDLLNQRKELEQEIQRLQEQIADANKTIDYYDKKDFHYTLADGTVMGAEPAHKYKIKWGVK